MGDRHVYGAKSRFMTAAVMACMEPVAFGDSSQGEQISGSKPTVDVAATLRRMWS
jgi:DNA helicase-2/ATP-dependent DNA helicase PcrA